MTTTMLQVMLATSENPRARSEMPSGALEGSQIRK